MSTVMRTMPEFQSTPPVKAATLAHVQQECTLQFQSTPPVKAATQTRNRDEMVAGFQSTPPVKAATCMVLIFASNWVISIHAAREGGDVLRGYT